MALGTDHETITTSANFIPEVWSDEVLAAYKSNLVASMLVKKIGFRGKKGDTIHVPKPARGAASQKAASTQVTLITDTAGVLNISIDQHWEYSRLIEDIAEVQRLASARSFYTDDAGYALAKKVDSALLAHAAEFQGGTAYSTAVIGGDGTTVWDGSASTNTGNGSDLTDAGLRRAIQTLDDNDVPLDRRSLLINPGQKNVLLGITRFSSSDFIGNDPRVKSGKFGDVYGASVYVTTNLPTVLADDSSTAYKACVLMGQEAIVHAEQLAVRTQTQYKQEYLGTLFTADTIYGTSVYRDTSGVALIVPA
jgi:hypothetical protein